MDRDIASWNLLQIAFIIVYPAWMSYTHMPSGMSLLAVYLFLFILCIPPVFIQLKLGNHQQKGVVGLLAKHIPLLKGVGITLLIQLFLICVYTVPSVTHYGIYAFISIAKTPYAWESCNNIWNVEPCSGHQIAADIEPLVFPDASQLLPVTAAAEAQFFDKEFLQITGNITDVRGFAIWTFSDEVKKRGLAIQPLAVVAVWLFIFLSLAFGSRVSGCILFVLGPAFLVLLFIVLGYGYSHLDGNWSSTFLKKLYTVDVTQFSRLQEEGTPVIKDWTAGMWLVMNSIPVWSAILPTMGKMTGSGRLTRNISWLFVILVYAVTCQLPQLSMAPYIGNLQHVKPQQTYEIKGYDVIFTTMAAAFSELDVPHVYSFLFFLGIFLAGTMFLIVSMFTLLDNLVEAIIDWGETFRDKRYCVNFCAGFALVSVGMGASILHTTQAGFYYIVFMEQCTMKLCFLMVAMYGLCLIIVYVQQNFGIAERIIMAVWCAVSTITTMAIFLYIFIMELGNVPGYRGVGIRGYWDLLCWTLASAPFLAIPAAMIHSFQQEDGSFSKRLKYVFCGTKQDPLDPPHDYGYHRPEPSAPPYGTTNVNRPDMYAYIDDNWPMDDVRYYKTNDE